MFTIDQIKQAHSKVKSGADFPNYVQDLIALGVVHYDTFVTDGHSEYFGEDTKIRSEAKYAALKIAKTSNIEKFLHYLKMHQQSQTDYLTFCSHSAETGVEKWQVDTKQMTCTYYDVAGKQMLEEQIPAK